MPNNLFTGFNVAIATETIDFATAGLNAGNCFIVFEINNVTLKSYIPGRSINPITGFEDGKGYYFVMKTNADLSAYLIPPVAASGDPGTVAWADIEGPLSGNAQLQDALDALAEAATQIGANTIATLRNGVATAGNDLAKLYTLIQNLNSLVTGTTPDGNSVTDTIQEILAIFSTYPEGVNVVTALAAKLNTTDFLTVLLSKFSTNGNVIATQDADQLRLDSNSNFVVENPEDIPDVPGGIVTKGVGVMNNTDTFTGTPPIQKIVSCTQSQYDGITTPDPNTFYVIL